MHVPDQRFPRTFHTERKKEKQKSNNKKQTEKPVNKSFPVNSARTPQRNFDELFSN
jgi:hypothetical protein